jgi:transposase
MVSAPRSVCQYPSDLTDDEWALLEPHLPAPKNTGPAGGRPSSAPLRVIVNAILYLLRTGCSWRQLPTDFPPWQSCYRYFVSWRVDGTVDRLHELLRERLRAAEGRDEPPTAGVIDAQSVRGAATVGAQSRGFDAGKKTNGRKRHIVVDTLGLLLVVMVTAANVQDRDAGREVLGKLRAALPGIRLVWADGGYAGKLVQWAKAKLALVLDIVRKRDGQRGFAVLPRRWVVERTLSWITNCRRLACDYERTIEHSEAMVKWAMIALMARRLARLQSGTEPAYNW